MNPPNTGALTALNAVHIVPIENGMSTLGLQLSGTFSATASFEASMDGGVTYISLTGYPAAGGAGVTSSTATGNWRFDVRGFTHFRVKASAYTSGTITSTVTQAASVLSAPDPARATLSSYFFLGIGSGQTVKGIYRDANGRQTGNSFSLSINQANGSNAGLGLPSIPADAVGATVRFSGTTYICLAGSSTADFVANYANYAQIGSADGNRNLGMVNE